MSHPTKCS